MATLKICDRCKEQIKDGGTSYKVKMVPPFELITGAGILVNGLEADLCPAHYVLLMDLLKEWLDGN